MTKKQVEEVVEAEVTEVVNNDPSPTVGEATKEIMIPLGSLSMAKPTDVINMAVKTAKALADIVDKLGLFFTLNRGGKITKYVYVDGWEVLGGMLGVGAHEESSIRLEDGSYESVVVLKRHSDGAIVGRGSAVCSVTEKDRNGNITWGSRDEFARKSMATTRAAGKAYRLAFSWIMKLAGYEGTPAEEMENLKDEPEKKPENKSDKSENKVDLKKLPFDERVEIAKKKWKTNILPPPEKQKGIIVAFGHDIGLDGKGTQISNALTRVKKKFSDYAYAGMIDFVIELARQTEQLKSEGLVEDHA